MNMQHTYLYSHINKNIRGIPGGVIIIGICINLPLFSCFNLPMIMGCNEMQSPVQGIKRKASNHAQVRVPCLLLIKCSLFLSFFQIHLPILSIDHYFFWGGGGGIKAGLPFNERKYE